MTNPYFDSTRCSPIYKRSIFEFNRCTAKCAKRCHPLNEHEILNTHAMFSALSGQQKNMRLVNYFSFHFPRDINGQKDIKNIQFQVNDKEVCHSLRLEILSL